MAPEHKFATAAKLCGEVLGGVADGLLPLQDCEEVLGDALRCLASKDIKVLCSLSACGPNMAVQDLVDMLCNFSISNLAACVRLHLHGSL